MGIWELIVIVGGAYLVCFKPKDTGGINVRCRDVNITTTIDNRVYYSDNRTYNYYVTVKTEDMVDKIKDRMEMFDR